MMTTVLTLYCVNPLLCVCVAYMSSGLHLWSTMPFLWAGRKGKVHAPPCSAVCASWLNVLAVCTGWWWRFELGGKPLSIALPVAQM